MAKRQVFISGVRARLALWSAQLEAFCAKVGDHANAEDHRRVDAWKAGALTIAAQLAELEALDDRWYATKAEIEKALRGIEARFGDSGPVMGAPGNGAAVTAGPPNRRQTA